MVEEINYNLQPPTL